MKNPFPVLDQSVMQGSRPPREDVKFFDVSDVHEIYVHSPVVLDPKTSHGDYGPLLLPYPSVWMEYEARYLSGGRQRVAVKAHELPVSFGGVHEPPVRLVALEVSVLAGGVVRHSPLVHYVHMNQGGEFLDQLVGPLPGFSPGRDFDPGDPVLTDQVMMHSGVALFALGLMNCKNTSLEVRHSGGKAGRKSKRVRKGVEYRVINLPTPRGASGPGGGGGVGEARYHTVRGHFKTYTADAPLMGKLTGTYWWSHQVRGDIQNGEIVSTYKVGK